MSKLTKKQRRQKRKKVSANKKRRKALELRGEKIKPQPWVAVKHKMFQLPPLLPDSVTKEQRLEIIRSISLKAKEAFDTKYPTIQRWFNEYDALYVLSFFAYYSVSHQEGLDPEISGAEEPFFHHYIEIMQALSLYQKRNFSAKPLMQDAGAIEEDMKSIGNSMSMKLLYIPENLKTEEEIQALRLRTAMMMDTTAVRNWAYFHQMKKTIFDLSKLIREDFMSVYDVDPFDFMQMLFQLVDQRNDLLNEHRSKVRNFIRKKTHLEMIDAYNLTFPKNKKIAGDAINDTWSRAGKNIKNLRVMLLCHSDLKLENIYSFTYEHAKSLMNTDVSLDTLKNLFAKLTLNFGDLESFPIDHIILGNPVNQKPFIKVNDSTLFSSVWGVIPHFAIDILENLVWENELLRDKYTNIKSKYLEDQIEELFKKGFPSAKIYRGSLWTDPTNGKTYENDLTVIVDHFAIIIEAKSGNVSNPAKRGAPNDLFETLQRLIEEPSEQALRFVDYFKKNKQIHNFLTKKGTLNVIDNSRINYYIPLGVTFSHLGMISSNLKNLIKAGVVKKTIDQLVPSMSFTDIDSIFEILTLEAEKIHYFSRRRELEAHLDYEGDELDLLAFYLDQGFNIGETEYTKDSVFNFNPKSKELDPYLIGKYEGKNIVKPELSMTDWWRDLLQTLAKRKMDGWIETSFILLNSTKEDQVKFQKTMGELVSRIRSNEVDKPHNWVLITTGPERRKYAIAFYPYTTNDRELRNTIMSQIIDDEHAKDARGIAVIGVNLNRNDYPYSVFARNMSTNLFDSLTV